MFAEKMVDLGSRRSTIREIFEFGKKRAAEVGRENVFDFSLGNPNVPAPESVEESIVRLVKTEDAALLHGYTSAQGDADVRNRIAEEINEEHGTHFKGDNLYMTVGAAASLCVCFKALAENPDDEFITFAPYFPEYKVFVEGAGGKLVVVPADIDTFQIHFEVFEKLLNPKTKAVIVNSPNNPSGVVYSEETILRLTEILKAKSEAYGHPIYLISDEPYREIAFDVKVPYLTNYYDNTFVCYSYSKSLSLPGERIGYVVVPDEMEEAKAAYAAVCGAGRALGYVCAPALFQRVAAECAGQTADISIYKKNRDLLYDALTEMGYTCVKPEGAFYLFPRSLEPDANVFCEKAKQFDLLLVPGDDFACPGHVRIAYCVQTEMIERSLKAFKKLAELYK